MKKLLIASILSGLCMTAFADHHSMSDRGWKHDDPSVTKAKEECHVRISGSLNTPADPHMLKKCLEEKGINMKSHKDKKHYNNRDNSKYDPNIQYDQKVIDKYHQEKKENQHRGPDAWP